MSGGHFDYKQNFIRDIADDVEQLILFNEDFDDDTIEYFKTGLEFLRLSQVYAQRIDWLVSGDDGEASLKQRLRDDLRVLK